MTADQTIRTEPAGHAVLRRYLKEPVNSISHLVGVGLSVAATVVLLVLAGGEPWSTVSFAVYGASAILLYTASSVLHGARVRPDVEHLLRRLDHAAIFIYIAGCYTPISLVSLRPEHPAWGWALLGGCWLLAIAGVTFKLAWFSAKRWLSTALYLLMGWLALAAIVPMLDVLPLAAMLWLLAGGLFYTAGAVIYALRKPDFAPGVFGYHELWHFFVLAGSGCHFVLMLYVLP